MGINVKRMIAAIIDFFAIAMAAMIFVGVFTALKIDRTVLDIVYSAFLALLVLFKDFVFKNASFGKKLLQLKIVKTDGTKPRFIDLLLRTLTLVIFPVEIILVLVRNKRLGDALAKTAVVEAVKQG